MRGPLVVLALAGVLLAGCWTLALTGAGDNPHADYVYRTEGH